MRTRFHAPSLARPPQPLVGSWAVRARRAALAAVLTAFGVIASGGCTTNLGTAAGPSYDRSTLVATSRTVVAITVAGADVYWLDSSGSVWSCDKAHCNNAPSLFYSGSAYQVANGEIAVSGDWLFWLAQGALYGCPTAGCSLTIPEPLVPQTISEFAADPSGAGIFWLSTAGDSTLEQYSPNCGSACPRNALAPLSTAAATTSPFPTGFASYGVTSLAVGNGRLYFVASNAIASCAAADCSWASLTEVRPESEPSPTLVGATATSLYFTDMEGLKRCDVASCTGTVVTLGPSVNSSFGSENVLPPMAVTPTGVLVPSPDASYGSYGIGASGYGGYWACPSAGCPAPAELSPDPALDPLPLGDSPPSSLPFAVDGTLVYWATSTLLGQPGSQIVTTPLP
jgi:hypothetical protein